MVWYPGSYIKIYIYQWGKGIKCVNYWWSKLHKNWELITECNNLYVTGENMAKKPDLHGIKREWEE